MEPSETSVTLTLPTMLTNLLLEVEAVPQELLDEVGKQLELPQTGDGEKGTLYPLAQKVFALGNKKYAEAGLAAQEQNSKAYQQLLKEAQILMGFMHMMTTALVPTDTVESGRFMHVCKGYMLVCRKPEIFVLSMSPDADGNEDGAQKIPVQFAPLDKKKMH
jgi:hypothetical protein